MKKLFTIISLILSFQALSCEVPPREQHVNALELIERTQRIALAIVTSASADKNRYGVSYGFEKIRAIKGEVSSSFTIEGYLLYEGGMRTFDNHFDEVFWSSSWGREFNDTACEIHPAFSVGSTYLVFLDMPFHSKSFEQIIRTHGDSQTKDKWLQYVEQQVSLNE